MQELIDLTPEQLADRRRLRLGASAPRAPPPDPEVWSEDSEWDPDWNSTSYLNCSTTRRELQAAVDATRAPKTRPGERAEASAAGGAPPSSDNGPWGEFGVVLFNGDPTAVREWRPVREFTPEYLEQERMKGRLRVQQRQRALAFWLPLATVFGAYAIRGIRRIMLGKARRPPDSKDVGKPPAKPVKARV